MMLIPAPPSTFLFVACGHAEVDELEPSGELVDGLAVPDHQVPAGVHLLAKAPDDASLDGIIEINQHVSAKDYVE